MATTYSRYSTTDSIPEEIFQVLDSLGISRSHKGYDYAAYAVNLLLKSGEKLPITKLIYPEISKAFRTTPMRVERGIRSAIDSAYKRSSNISEYFKGLSKKTTNAQFIYTIASRLHRESIKESNDREE